MPNAAEAPSFKKLFPNGVPVDAKAKPIQFGGTMFAKTREDRGNVVRHLKNVNATDVVVTPIKKNAYGKRYKITYTIPDKKAK